MAEAPLIQKPRHNPDAEGAIVMRRPKIKANTQIVDVVIDPILSKHLRPHQQEGVSFLYECMLGMKEYDGTGAILADEMGLGKTLQSITLLWTLLKQSAFANQAPPVKRALIVCPATLVDNWKREFKKWLGDERIKVFAASAPTISKKNADDSVIKDFLLGVKVYPILIVNYERLRTLQDHLDKVTFDIIICDEGHRLKSAQIKTSQALARMSCKRRIILSGTPIQNNLQEYFAMVDFVNPGVMGTLSTFRSVFEGPIIKSRQPGATEEDREIGESRCEEMMRLTSMFVLRRTSKVNEKYLPPKRKPQISNS